MGILVTQRLMSPATRRRSPPPPPSRHVLLLAALQLWCGAHAASTKWVRETPGAAGPGTRAGAAGVIVNGNLFVVGGESGAGRLLQNDAWS